MESYIYSTVLLALIAGVTYRWFCSNNVDIAIEAESMTGSIEKLTDRERASGYQSVHLYEGETLSTEICLDSNTKITVKDLRYSNDGDSDRIRVSFDNNVIGEFHTEREFFNGVGWERFKTYPIMYSNHDSGRHSLEITVLDADQDGVEIDALVFQLSNSQSAASINCTVVCLNEIEIPYTHPTPPPTTFARAVQKSTETNCAEEGNVNIPIFHDNLSSYVVTASLPRYHSPENTRGPDWRNCKIVSDFLKYTDVSLSDSLQQSTPHSQLKITPESSSATRIALIEVDFELEGPSTGSIDSEVGTNVNLNFLKFDGELSFRFQYYGRYDMWSEVQHRVAMNCNVTFTTPDFSFKEGAGNKVRIEVLSDQGSTTGYSIGEFFMHKRRLKPVQTTTLFNNNVTLIVSVIVDMWWRVNETMTVTILNGTTVNNATYIRIYRKVPWTPDSFSEIFVLYQDGHVRLCPTTPYGLDWIPFGSTVLIGQRHYTSFRSCAPITEVLVDPHLLIMNVSYADNGYASMRLVNTLTETRLQVSDVIFTKDVTLYPFFTFRSGYVSDGNGDVDHISIDGRVKRILDPWGTQHGNFFAFFRKCISMHHPQSPDISLKVTNNQHDEFVFG